MSIEKETFTITKHKLIVDEDITIKFDPDNGDEPYDDIELSYQIADSSYLGWNHLAERLFRALLERERRIEVMEAGKDRLQEANDRLNRERNNKWKDDWRPSIDNAKTPTMYPYPFMRY